MLSSSEYKSKNKESSVSQKDTLLSFTIYWVCILIASKGQTLEHSEQSSQSS